MNNTKPASPRSSAAFQMEFEALFCKVTAAAAAARRAFPPRRARPSSPLKVKAGAPLL